MKWVIEDANTHLLIREFNKVRSILLVMTRSRKRLYLKEQVAEWPKEGAKLDR
jgi:hypothetical protein